MTGVQTCALPISPSATTASDAPAAAPLVSFAPLPAEPAEAAATTTAAARAVAASGESPTTATPAVTPPPVLIVPDDVPVDPDFTPPAAPPVPVPDTPIASSPAPPTDFAVDAAELLDRFFPFDLAGLRAQAQAVFDDLGAALPDADDLLGERGWWYAAALAAMLATRRGVARRARGRGYRRSLR